MIEDPNDGEPVTPCMDVYKAKIQYDGILDNFVTSAKFLGSGMKWETSEPYDPKCANSCKISFTIELNT